MVRWHWPLWGLLLVFASALALAAAPMPTTDAPGDLVIRLDGGALTVHAKQVPHRQILEALADRLHFELIIAGPLEERRSLEIEARPWEEALKRALAPASWAFVYHPTAGEPQLAKVFVFPAKEGSPPGTGLPARAGQPAPAPPHPPPTSRAEAPVGPDQPPGDPAVGVKLHQLLEADDEETRALALIGLASTGGEEAISALKQALQDKEPWVRETAVEALAELGGDQAMQGLEQALQDDNADVRRAAQEALSRLRPEAR